MSSPRPANATPFDSAAGEIARIRAEYERRHREIPHDCYSWGRPVNYFMHCQLVRQCIVELRRAGMYSLAQRSVADIGCGTGQWLLEFAQWQATDLHGIDLDEIRVACARASLPAADLYVGDAQHLPWPDHCFDLVTQFTVFTSILNRAVKTRIAMEMLRVLKPGGLVLWYDFRVDNPHNPNVRGIKAIEIRALFPHCEIRLKRVTLAPPIARALVPVSWLCATALETIPFLRTHYLALIRKTSD